MKVKKTAKTTIKKKNLKQKVLRRKRRARLLKFSI